MNKENYQFSIHPMNNLSDFLTAAYILSNYSYYGDKNLTSVINVITGVKIDQSDISLLRSRLIASPKLYGIDFLYNIKRNLADRIDSILQNEVVLNFESPATNCSFCNRYLSGKFFFIIFPKKNLKFKKIIKS